MKPVQSASESMLLCACCSPGKADKLHLQPGDETIGQQYTCGTGRALQPKLPPHILVFRFYPVLMLPQSLPTTSQQLRTCCDTDTLKIPILLNSSKLFFFCLKVIIFLHWTLLNCTCFRWFSSVHLQSVFSSLT